MEDMLKQILNELKELKSDVSELKQGQQRIENKLDGVVEQTADLTEFRAEVNIKLEDLKEVKEVTKENCYEIARIKAVK